MPAPGRRFDWPSRAASTSTFAAAIAATNSSSYTNSTRAATSTPCRRPARRIRPRRHGPRRRRRASAPAARSGRSHQQVEPLLGPDRAREQHHRGVLACSPSSRHRRPWRVRGRGTICTRGGGAPRCPAPRRVATSTSEWTIDRRAPAAPGPTAPRRGSPAARRCRVASRRRVAGRAVPKASVMRVSAPPRRFPGRAAPPRGLPLSAGGAACVPGSPRRSPRPASPARLATGPEGAWAELDAGGLHVLVLMAGVEHHAHGLVAQQLPTRHACWNTPA